MDKSKMVVIDGGKPVVSKEDSNKNVISDRDCPVALAFLARILDEMSDMYQGVVIHGEDSVISYDNACMVYKELLLKEYPCA